MNQWKSAAIIYGTLLISACSNGGSSSPDTAGNVPPPLPPNTPVVVTSAPAPFSITSLNLSAGKQPRSLAIEWTVNQEDIADHFILRVNKDGGSGFRSVVNTFDSTARNARLTLPVLFTDFANAQYMVEALSDEGDVIASSPIASLLGNITPEQIIGYFKASNSDSSDNFGESLAINQDGSMFVAGAYNEASASQEINKNENDNSAAEAGAAYIFTASEVDNEQRWTQSAYLKPSNLDAGDYFSFDIATNADGSVVAVSSIFEDSNATTINGDKANNSARSTGAVYIFSNSSGNWEEQAYIKPSNAEAGDLFGYSIALSANGDTLVVGARGESSNGVGDLATQKANNDMFGAGAVYVFDNVGGVWSETAYLKAENVSSSDEFGGDVSISAAGDLIAVGVPNEDSSARGIDGPKDELRSNSGAVYIYEKAGSTWVAKNYIKASNASNGDKFGGKISLSADGKYLAVSAKDEDSDSAGVTSPTSASAFTSNAGAAYVFHNDSVVGWQQQAFIKSIAPDAQDRFGLGLALNDAGDTLVVGSPPEDSLATGLDGDATDNSSTSSIGAAYLYRRSGTTWSFENYIKPPFSKSGEVMSFGNGIAIDGLGRSVLVGAASDAGAVQGINPDRNNFEANHSGAVFLY